MQSDHQPPAQSRSSEAEPTREVDLEKAAVPAVENGPPNGEKHQEEDANVVSWDGDDDVQNPLNWAAAKKWSNTAVIAALTFITPLASSMFAPAVGQTMSDFHSTNVNVETFVVSVYVLGFAAGPLPVYLISTLLFVILSIACAVSSSLNMLIVFRFFAGCAGSTPIALGGATIGDMFPREKRGAVMSIWGLGPLLGPIVGPIIGGFLAQAKGWRWIFWLQSIIAGVVLSLGLALLQETHATVLLERKTKRLIRETGNHQLRSKLAADVSGGEVFKRAIVRPLVFLFLSPVVTLLSLYVAVVFGYLYLFITTLPAVFQGQYHFTTGTVGLSYLGLGVGLMAGLGLVGGTSNRLYLKMTERNGGVYKPEFRLPPMMFTCPLLAIAFFWYGWSAEAKVHWIVPIIGTGIFGIGMIGTFLSVNMYLVDTYTRYAASAIAAVTLLRSVAGAVLPLVGRPLYEHLGLGWGNSVLAFIALALLPIPWLFFRYGESLRNRFKVKL